MLKHVLGCISLALAASAIPAAAQNLPPAPRLSQNPTDQAPSQKGTQGTRAILTLTAEERHTVLQNVDRTSAGNSTMGLGALTEGATIPSNAKLQAFNDTVSTKIPKLKNYAYFSTENKIAIVDPFGRKILAVLDDTSN